MYWLYLTYKENNVLKEIEMYFNTKVERDKFIRKFELRRKRNATK